MAWMCGNVKPLEVTPINPIENLFHSAQECRACERMSGCRRILSPANGSINASIMFVAEAPGRLGAEKYGIPLFGDRTGINFDLLLGVTGLSRKDVFITNAVICNPRTKENLNDSPTMGEIRNCNTWLRQTIQAVSPQIIITLGRVALFALSLIEEHELTLREDIGKPVKWFGRYLVPLYHVGPRALIHRNLSRQKNDYKRLKKLFTQLAKPEMFK